MPNDSSLPPVQRPRIAVAINSKAGTARTADRGQLRERLREVLSPVGDVADITFVEPRAFKRTLAALAARADLDIVVVGGGDGSISTAGTIFAGTGKTMGVIPLGTFNLFARSLGIPIGMDAALDALPQCVAKAVDVGTMVDGTGRRLIFLHHVSFGFHPKFIEIRDAIPYASRLGKILASFRVWRRTLRSLKRLSITIHGDVERPKARYYQVAVTVGSFREAFGDLPHAEDLTKGDLDLLLLPARGQLDFVMAVLQAALGRWRSNTRIEAIPVRLAVLERNRPDPVTISVDGELVRCVPPFTFKVEPKALRVLMPPKAETETLPPAVESAAMLR